MIDINQGKLTVEDLKEIAKKLEQNKEELFYKSICIVFYDFVLADLRMIFRLIAVIL